MTAYHWCLPCGCLFVLSGAGQTEEQKRASVMPSVNFLEEPERLKGIVTTPENIKRVKKWTEQSGLKGAVCSFDEF